MGLVTRAEAEQLTGKSRATLLRHVKKGQLSGEKNRDGQWVFDTSELARVYGDLKALQGERGQDEAGLPQGEQGETVTIKAEVGTLQAEIDHLKERLQDKEALLEEKDARIGDLQKAMMLLTDQREKPDSGTVVESKKKGGFINWLKYHAGME